MYKTSNLDKLKELMEKVMLGDYLDEILVMAALMDYEIEHNNNQTWSGTTYNHNMYFIKHKIKNFVLEMKFRDSVLKKVELRKTTESYKIIKKSIDSASHHMTFIKLLEVLE